MLYTIAFVNGVILVLDVPSRQQLTYRMVGRDALPNAIALNSSLFNASRIFGPSLAGVILGFGGVGVCFTVNAISFLAVLLGLLAMRTNEFFPRREVRAAGDPARHPRRALVRPQAAANADRGRD